ncbi:hypothetical protein F5883DRAFT_359713, partial [Diaporthe sp. PMI_573]
SFLRFLRDQRTPLTDPTTSFSGKNVIVAGGNRGLGLEAAITFARLNASRVILGVRNVAKGAKARQVIQQRSGRNGIVHVWELDFNSYESIQAFTRRASSELDHLDITVLNA